MPAKAPYDGFYDVQFYYTDPAISNVKPEPSPAQPLTLANFGGRYMPITSNEFWQQKAPGQVVVPSYVDYTNTMYALGPADNMHLGPQIRYGADEPFPIISTVFMAFGFAIAVGIVFWLIRKK